MRETDEPHHGRTGTAPLPRASEEDSWEAPPMFGAAGEEPQPRRRGMTLWFAAAAALVVGIVIGFGAGYRAAQMSTQAAVSSPDDGQPAESSDAPPPAQTFSESNVAEPIRIDPPPVVAAPVPAEPAPERPTAAAVKPPAAPPDRAPRAAAVPAPPRAPAAGPGSLQVVSRPPGARIILDGKIVGVTPLVISDVAAGAHTVQIDLPGFNRWATTVEVTAGSQLRVAASLEQ